MDHQSCAKSDMSCIFMAAGPFCVRVVVSQPEYSLASTATGVSSLFCVPSQHAVSRVHNAHRTTLGP